jgi:hypothetical protein
VGLARHRHRHRETQLVGGIAPYSKLLDRLLEAGPQGINQP